MSFRPGSFRLESFQPWAVSADFGKSFRPDFSSPRLVTEGEINIYEASSRVQWAYRSYSEFIEGR